MKMPQMGKINVLIMGICLMAGLALGCAGKQPGTSVAEMGPEKPLPPKASQEVETVEVTEPTRSVSPDEAGQETPREPREEVARLEAPSPETQVEAARPSMVPDSETLFQDVFFDFDRYNIRPDAIPALEHNAQILRENPQWRIRIEGHADERGTNEYNLILGERRAESVRRYLVALGIDPSRIEIVSYGEERPFCTAHEESCWQLNRRAHFVLIPQ